MAFNLADEYVEVLLPTGRLVGGHPMIRRPVTDRRTSQPKLQKDNITPRTNVYVAVAILKQGETDWRQTQWGQQIQQVAQRDWPQGQWQDPEFAWKVEDGDSTKIKKGGGVPNSQREGHPGHWIIKASTELNPPKCFHYGHFSAHEQIQDHEAIKPGDYIQLALHVKWNGPVSESPGMYLNPILVSLVRAGQRIILESGPDAAAVFGNAPAVLPPGALIDTSVAAPAPVAPPAVPAPMAPPAAPAPVAPPAAPAPMAPPAGIAPAPDFLNPPAPPAAPAPVAERFSYSGAAYTRDQLKASGWQDAQIDALPRA